MQLTPLQRKAEFARARTLKSQSMTAAAFALGCSRTHLKRAMATPELASTALKQAIATYCGMPYEAFWGVAPALAQAS